MIVIDKLAPFKTKRLKLILENIAPRDKLFRKFKLSKLNVDNEIYSKARKKSHELILEKRRVLRKKIKRAYC